MYQIIKKLIAEILVGMKTDCSVLISKDGLVVLEVNNYLGVISVLLGVTYFYVCSPCPMTYFDECAQLKCRCD